MGEKQGVSQYRFCRILKLTGTRRGENWYGGELWMKRAQPITMWMSSRKMVEGFLRRDGTHSMKDLSREKLNSELGFGFHVKFSLPIRAPEKIHLGGLL